MNRVTGLLLIVFLAISSVSAHAGAAIAVADTSQTAHQQMSDHDHGEMMKMGAGDAMKAEHIAHVSGCSLGHCAIACALILSHFSFSASEVMSPSDHWMGDHRLIGKATAFEPPPPKA